jgi:Putative prokaryotic signal transducing protein
MTDWKKIYESTSTIKAQLAKAYLMDEHQIEAIVLNKQDSSYLFGLCEVHVPLKDAVLAKFLLENEGGLN